MAFRKTVFFRLMLFVLLIVVTLTVCTFAIFRSAASRMLDQNFKAAEEQVRSAMTVLSEDLDRISEVANMFFSDKDIYQLAYSGSYLDSRQLSQLYNRISQKMEVLLQVSNYVTDVRLHLRFADRTLTAGKRYSIGQMDENGYRALRDLVLLEDRRLAVRPESVDLLFHNLSTQSSKVADEYILEVLLDRDKLWNLLETQRLYDNAVCVLWDSRKSETLLQSGESAGEMDLTGLLEGGARQEWISGGVRYEAFPYGTQETGLSMLLLIPSSEIYRTLSRFNGLFTLFTVAAFAAIILYLIYCYRTVRRPMKEIIDATYSVERGDFNIHVQAGKQSEYVMLCDRFNLMAANLSALIDRVYKQEILMKHTELKQLHAQIHPHFLYNSFFILSRMIQAEDNENAERMLEHLGRYFEYITRDSGAFVLLEKELSHAREYMEIQLVRFAGQFRYEIEQPELSWQGLCVPRLILQPVAENYFKYAVKSSDTPLVLSIRFRQREDKLHIVFEDSICRIAPGTLEELDARLSGEPDGAEVTGLVNISRRLRLLYGPGCGVMLENLVPRGVRTTLILSVNRPEEVD